MGWSQGRIIERSDITEEITCSICNDIVKSPLQTPCQHVFCGECITGRLEMGKSNCPIDQEILDVTELKPLPRILEKFLSNLTIRCENYENGCSFNTKLENLSLLFAHQTSQCMVAKYDKLKLEHDELKANVKNQERDMSDLRQNIKEKYEKISELEEVIDHQGKIIIEQKEEIDARVGTITEEFSKLSEKGNELEEMANKITEINNSIKEIFSPVKQREIQSAETPKIVQDNNSTNVYEDTSVTNYCTDFEDNSDHGFQLFIRYWYTTKFETIAIFVKPSDSIGDIIIKIGEKQGIFKIFSKFSLHTSVGKTLQDNLSLKDYGIEATTTLQLRTYSPSPEKYN